jgi:hypothetical protein
MVIPKLEPKDQFGKKMSTVIKQRLIVCLLLEEASLHFIKEMAKYCQLIGSERIMIAFQEFCYAQERICYQKPSQIKNKVHFWLCQKMLIKSLDQLQSCCCCSKTPDQDIKRRPRHQDKTRRRRTCLLAWMDLARMDLAWKLCLDWIGKFSSR